MPKLSVIMPVYNGGLFLGLAVESILKQTWIDFELIIIDDGSTDRSADVIRSFRDQRIVLIDRMKNEGVVVSANQGLKLARGQYIARMDQDDISVVHRFERQVEFLDAHPSVGLVGSSYVLIDDQGKVLRRRELKTRDADIKKALWEEHQFCHGAVMYRKACLDQVGLYRDRVRYAEDYDLFFRIAEKWEVANISEPLYQLRMNLQSISSVNRFEQIRHAELVKILARQRQNASKDDLDDLSEKDFTRRLNQILPQNRANEQKVFSQNFFHYADLFYAAGNYAQARQWIGQSLKYRRTSLKIWILAVKIFMCCWGAEKIVGFLRRLRKQERVCA